MISNHIYNKYALKFSLLNKIELSGNNFVAYFINTISTQKLSSFCKSENSVSHPKQYFTRRQSL